MNCVRVSENGRVLATPTPLSKPFFDAARNGQLLLPCCPRDGYFFYPRNRCPVCLQDNWNWQQARRQGTVYSYTVDRVGLDPANRSRVPLVIALVDLVDGPRVTGNVVKCKPDSVAVGMIVSMEFECIGDSAVLLFQPHIAVHNDQSTNL